MTTTERLGAVAHQNCVNPDCLAEEGERHYSHCVPDPEQEREETPEGIFEILHHGMWCRDCEYVEHSEDVNGPEDFCTGCGCSTSRHVKVMVVVEPDRLLDDGLEGDDR